MARMGAVGGKVVEARVADGLPDPIHVKGVFHDRVADPVPAADPPDIAGQDDLCPVKLNSGGARRDRRVERTVVHHLVVCRHLDLT